MVVPITVEESHVDNREYITMKNKLLTAAVLSSMLLIACTNESKVEGNSDIQDTQELTGSNENSNAASGVVKDGALVDGVRPDVADYIKTRYRGEDYEPVMKYARSAQAVLDSDTTNQDDMMVVYENYLQEMTCLHTHFPNNAANEYENGVVIDINSITVDNSERTDRFTNFLKGLPTSEFPLGNPDKC